MGAGRGGGRNSSGGGSISSASTSTTGSTRTSSSSTDNASSTCSGQTGAVSKRLKTEGLDFVQVLSGLWEGCSTDGEGNRTLWQDTFVKCTQVCVCVLRANERRMCDRE